MTEPRYSPAVICILASVLAGCTTAASVSEDALRRATFNRIQATPFTDRIDAKACRQSLDQAYGFPRKSLAIKEGVQVSQAYSCKGQEIIAKVSLKNLNPHPMYCAAFTETDEIGVWVGPSGISVFEYSFADAVSYDCFKVS